MLIILDDCVIETFFHRELYYDTHARLIIMNLTGQQMKHVNRCMLIILDACVIETFLHRKLYYDTHARIIIGTSQVKK